jgi:hypothetical protein
MTNAPDSFNLDVRIRERLLKKRVITSATVDSHLSGLKDAESDSVTLDLEQPALAKPPVVVAPVVQPVQPVRSSVADLPPPPPGLIKESPTPPYTPMVIENVPRDSSVNGVNLSAVSTGTGSVDNGAAAGYADTSAAEAAEADASDDEDDDLDDESPEADVAEGEPKGEGSVDDEWGG